MNDGLGKKAEQKIKEWLDRPKDGYSFDRVKDQMTGMYGSKNICDFTLYKYPCYYYIESKATWEDRFPWSMITEYQYNGLLEKSKIRGVRSFVIVLFASHQRAFIFDIRDIDVAKLMDIKSVNIKKIDKWQIPYREIRTEPNPRKQLLDYIGDIEEYT